MDVIMIEELTFSWLEDKKIRIIQMHKTTINWYGSVPIEFIENQLYDGEIRV